MTVAKIKINKKELASDSKDLKNLIVRLESNQKNMQTILQEISVTWVGDASQAFVNKLNKEIEKSQNIIKVLRQYDNYINSVISKFDELERSGSNKIESSF